MGWYQVKTLPEALRNYAFTFATGFAVGAYVVFTNVVAPKQQPPASMLEQRAREYLHDNRLYQQKHWISNDQRDK